MRKFIIGVAALLALLVATALIAPNLIDWNTYKGDIVAQAKAATGRDLTIDGDIDFLVLPSLQLTATNIRFANVRGGSAPDMVRLKSLDIQVRLLPLLQGRIEADAITLIEPVILLERLADGRVNWDLAAAKKNAAATVSAPSQAVGEYSGGLLQGVQLDNVRIRRGTVIYRDALVGTEERIAGLSVQVGVRSLSGPFRIKGDVILRGVPVSFDAAVGALKPTEPAPINLQVTVPSAGTRLELSGGAVITGEDKNRVLINTFLREELAQPADILVDIRNKQTQAASDTPRIGYTLATPMALSQSRVSRSVSPLQLASFYPCYGILECGKCVSFVPFQGIVTQNTVSI